MGPNIMVPEFGHFALVIAFCLSFALFVLPALGAYYGNQLLMHTGRSLSAGLFVFAYLTHSQTMTFQSSMLQVIQTPCCLIITSCVLYGAATKVRSCCGS